ncbi:MAG TPA: cytochrome c oxidase subunit 3 [Pyrinomonadaceae bacterium]|jgi:heme/copper-type cytochrome/quinol oxidase subunit 3
MTQRPAIDVSGLPEHGFDAREPLWWGNLFLLFIETTMFGILVATYFYLRQNFQLWPPPRVYASPYQVNPLPDLFVPTINLILIVISCVPMILADKAARRGDRLAALIGLTACIAFGVAASVLRWHEFSALKFQWDENAYGSVVWFILGMHFLHLLTATAEAVFVTLWIIFRGFDVKHRVDITITSVYWYWVAGIWIPLYAIVWFVPRWQ